MSAVNDPVWSYGTPVLLQTVGTAPDDRWAYGQPLVVMEYYAASPGGMVIPVLSADGVHAAVFGGQVLRG